MREHYWAVRPKAQPDIIRIEKASSAREACRMAFGRTIKWNVWEAKDLGTRIEVVQTDKKRIPLLRETSGWEEIT